MDHFKKNPFVLERYFALYEFSAPNLLCCSDCESMSMSELLSMADAETKAKWETLSLGYTESQGLPELREAVAGLYDGVEAAGVLIGAPQELILLGLSSMLGEGDHAVVMWPGYQSLHETVLAAGAELSKLDVTSATFDLVADTTALLKPNTRAVVLNLPHNPTGFLPTKEEFAAINALCSSRGIQLFVDEMYRNLEMDSAAHTLPSACEISETGLTLCGLSKSFGLPGLRLGWLCSKDVDFITKTSHLKDYTTICTAAPSEILALVAIKSKEAIWKRSTDIIRENLKHAEGFFTRHSSRFAWTAPLGGPIGFPELLQPGKGGVLAFCEKLVKDKGVMLLPATVYGSDKACFRMGLGRKNFLDSLNLLEEWLATSEAVEYVGPV